MRKLIALLLVLGFASFTMSVAFAQEESTEPTQVEEATPDTTAQAEEAAAPVEEAPVAEPAAEESKDGPTGFQVLKEKFIEGDWKFMSTVLVCLILGLAFCIERIITLNIATTNTDKLLARIDENLKKGDVEGAMEVCKSTQGPTASILYEGLKNTAQGP
ncbi:hypothetical protein RZS08_29305, partial [Arthrospira platensis SPKY1]|nr:hypothetical protein [Arthrospira platensis SPKY1]